MLTFHPEYRITVEEALEHPYLEELHSQMDEPVSKYILFKPSPSLIDSPFLLSLPSEYPSM